MFSSERCSVEYRPWGFRGTGVLLFGSVADVVGEPSRQSSDSMAWGELIQAYLREWAAQMKSTGLVGARLWMLCYIVARFAA
jgi:hypothetical protein